MCLVSLSPVYIDMQEICEICTRRVNKAIEAMDVGGQILGSGVLAKVQFRKTYNA